LENTQSLKLDAGREGMTARDFLRMLWPEPELPGHFYLTTIEKWGQGVRIDTLWFDTLDAAVGAVPGINNKDIYYGVGLARKIPRRVPGRAAPRCTKANVAAIPGLWLDLDVTKEGSRKKYFPDRDAARRFVEALPVPPTVLVWTGGGYHVYWLFDEPVELEGAAERRVFEALSKGWQRFIRSRAQAQGATVDSTFNLDRILRLPGTTNLKWQAAVEIEGAWPERRYNTWDFDDYVDINPALVAPAKGAVRGEEQEARQARLKKMGINAELAAEKVADLATAKYKGLIFNFQGAQPPAEKFAALRDLEPRFLPTWNRTRKLKDCSASGYDLALASFAAHAGWSDQEIVDLLIAHRRKHGDLAKLVKRRDYLLHPVHGVIPKAVASVQDRDALLDMKDMTDEIVQERQEAQRRLALDRAEQDRLVDVAAPRAIPASEEKDEEDGGERKKELSEDRRRRRLKKVREFTGLPVRRILKYGARRNGRYVLVMDGDIRESLGEVDEFRNQETWINLSCIYGSKLMMPMKKAQWLSVPFTVINSIVEVIEMEEMNDEALTVSWVRSMASGVPNYTYAEKKDAEPLGCFIYKGEVWVQAGELVKHIAMVGGGRHSHNKMCERLRNAGFERRLFAHYERDGSSGTEKRRKWRSYFVCDWEKLMGINPSTAIKEKEVRDGEEREEAGVDIDDLSLGRGAGDENIGGEDSAGTEGVGEDERSAGREVGEGERAEVCSSPDDGEPGVRERDTDSGEDGGGDDPKVVPLWRGDGSDDFGDLPGGERERDLSEDWESDP